MSSLSQLGKLHFNEFSSVKEEARNAGLFILISFSLCSFSYMLGSNGFGMLVVFMCLNSWYFYNIYKKLENLWDGVDNPNNYLVFKQHDGKEIKLPKPTTTQIMILGGCIASLLVALTVSYKIKNNLTVEAKNDEDRKRNILIHRKWEKFKEMAIWCGLMPLTLSKDMEALNQLVTYVTDNYKKATTIHKMWNNISLFFEVDTPEDNVIHNSTIDEIVAKLKPVIENQVDKSIMSSTDKIVEKVTPIVEKNIEANFVDVAEELDREDAKESVSLVVQMDKVKQESDPVICDESELPDSDNDYVDDDEVKEASNSAPNIVPIPGLIAMTNTLGNNSSNTYPIAFPVSDDPSYQMRKIQAVIDSNNSRRYGLGYKGNPRTQLLNKIESIKKYFSSVFDTFCFFCIGVYVKIRQWRFAKHVLITFVSVTAVAGLAYAIHKYFNLFKYNKNAEAGKTSSADRNRKYVRKVMVKLATKHGGRMPKEVYDDVKTRVTEDVDDGNYKRDNAWEDYLDERMKEWEDDIEGGPSQQFTKRGFKAKTEAVSVSVTINSNDKANNTLKTATTSGEDKNESVVAESKNNKTKQVKKRFIYRKAEWRKKSAKPEHLVSGSGVSGVPFLYTLMGIDEHNQMCYSNVYPANNVLVACRHGVSGMKKLFLLLNGKKVEIDRTEGIISRNVIDQVYIPVMVKNKPNLDVKMNSGRNYASPTKGELGTFFFCNKNGVLQHVVGTFGPTRQITHTIKDKDGKDRVVSITLQEWNGSTIAGSCGGVYVDQLGNIVGFHGVGSDNSSSKPMFYPCDDKWSSDVNMVMLPDNINYRFGEDTTYTDKYEKGFLRNGHLTIEDAIHLNLKGCQN